MWKQKQKRSVKTIDKNGANNGHCHLICILFGYALFFDLKKIENIRKCTLNWNANQKPPPVTSQLCCWIQLSSKIVMPFNKKVWCNCNTFYACTYSHVRDDTHITSMKTVQFSTLPTRCPTTSEMCLFMAQA